MIITMLIQSTQKAAQLISDVRSIMDKYAYTFDFGTKPAFIIDAWFL